MIRKILLPVDFSEYSLMSVECGRDLKDLGAEEIVLLHVIDEKFTDPLRYSKPEIIQTIVESYRREVEKKLREIEEKLSDFKVKIRIEFGEPAEEILRVAEEEKVSLIYMSGRGESWLLPRMFGGVAEVIAASSFVPVLFTKFEVVQEAGKNYCKITFSRIFDKILYATDFSETAERLKDWIERIGEVSKRVDIVIATGDLKPEEGESFEDALKRIEGKALDLKEDLESKLNVPVNVFIIPEEAGRAIIEVAEREKPTLIAIGANGIGKAKGIGRTADEVLRRSRYPVLLFKAT
ncbi:UspA domain protein [Ferroglobus placidus DSM 10642]|uniref:UspA domain protein n=1 Tax=Ferroglobus placidus (strain DSM 10642 / AEDII12DO) TaxID=589924 RepID=D3S046_FERPA|nr:universal stress protein [Ferroglobus placidus]ADC66109.1 UspA domain protein [Ferroglobus placidus DSM 10642]